ATFAGEWYDPSYRQHCLELVRANHLGEHVEFIGPVGEEEKKEWLNSCDLTVFVPVKPEGSPWVVLEAMAAARPVIGSRQGVIPEVMVEGVTGYVIPNEDVVALADRILRLTSDPARAATMGRHGRRRVEEVYSERVTHRRLASVIREAAGWEPLATK